MRRFVFLFALFAAAHFADVYGQDAPNALTPDEQTAGWKLLFDGKNLIGFKGLEKTDFLQAGWKIEEGALKLPKSIDQSGKMTGGNLVSTFQAADFEFAFEWKLAVSAASGILYGAHTSLGMKPTGFEFQLIDDVHNPDGLKGGPIRRTGALYGILPPGPNKKINDTGWNNGLIVVHGNTAEHWVNGEKVLEYQFGSPALQQAIRSSTVKLGFSFGAKAAGPIVLLDKGEEVWFRSLKVKLPALAPAAAAVATPRPAGPTPFKSKIPIPGVPD